MSNMSLIMRRRHRVAFTLVELLVVIGIIALLIAILLPALNRARQAAQRTVCASKLQQMMIAAQTHANDHRGFYPLAGVLPDCTPSDLIHDTYATNYTYFSFVNAPTGFNPRQLTSITVALASEMGYKSILSAPDDATYVKALNDPKGFLRNFICPGQANDSLEIEAMGPGAFFMTYVSLTGTGSDSEPISYAFNEAVVGYNDSLGRLRGHAVSVRQPSNTFFACDANHGAIATRTEGPAGLGYMTLWNNTAVPPVTMADAYINRKLFAGTTASFDSKRHQGKINVAFCDGHVELRSITVSDLQKIFLIAP